MKKNINVYLEIGIVSSCYSFLRLSNKIFAYYLPTLNFTK